MRKFHLERNQNSLAMLQERHPNLFIKYPLSWQLTIWREIAMGKCHIPLAVLGALEALEQWPGIAGSFSKWPVTPQAHRKPEKCFHRFKPSRLSSILRDLGCLKLISWPSGNLTDLCSYVPHIALPICRQTVPKLIWFLCYTPSNKLFSDCHFTFCALSFIIFFYLGNIKN